MARRTVIDPKLWMDQFVLSPRLMAFNLSLTKTLHEVSAFGEGSIERLPGLSDSGITGSGYHNTTAALSEAVAAVGAQVGSEDGGIWTLAPTEDPQVGDVIYLLNPRLGDITHIQGSVGEVSKLDFNGEGDAPAARGSLILDETIDEDSGTTMGQTADNTAWVAMPGGGDLVVHLHVFGVSGGGTQSIRVRRATSAGGAAAANVIASTNLTGANAPPFIRRVVVPDAPAMLWVQLDWDVGASDGEIEAVFAAGRTA